MYLVHPLNHRPTRPLPSTFRIPTTIFAFKVHGIEHERQEYLSGCTDNLGIEDGDRA